MFIVSVSYKCPVEEVDVHHKADVAEYDITEFNPTMAAEGYEILMGKQAAFNRINPALNVETRCNQ